MKNYKFIFTILGFAFITYMVIIYTDGIKKEAISKYYRSFDFVKLEGLEPLKQLDYPCIFIDKNDSVFFIKFMLNDTIDKSFKVYKRISDSIYYNKILYDKMGFVEFFEYFISKNIFEERHTVYPDSKDSLNKIISITRFTNNKILYKKCSSYKKSNLIKSEYFNDCLNTLTPIEYFIKSDSLIVLKENKEVIGKAKISGKFRYWISIIFNATDFEDIKFKNIFSYNN